MANPIEYAEKTLGVHVPWNEAVATFTRFDDIRLQLAEARNQLRDLLAEHDDLLTEQRTVAAVEYSRGTAAGSPDSEPPLGKFSQAGLDRYIADTIAGSEAVRLSNKAIREQRNIIELLEAQESTAGHKLQFLTARLNELGGLLHFYAMRSPAPR